MVMSAKITTLKRMYRGETKSNEIEELFQEIQVIFEQIIAGNQDQQNGKKHMRDARDGQEDVLPPLDNHSLPKAHTRALSNV